jgi:hypothetical protein
MYIVYGVVFARLLIAVTAGCNTNIKRQTSNTIVLLVFFEFFCCHRCAIDPGYDSNVNRHIRDSEEVSIAPKGPEVPKYLPITKGQN